MFKRDLCRLIVFALGILPYHAFSQKQSSHWVFGERAMIDFSTAQPSVTLGSPMDAPEGSAAISDQNGTLLFYTNGEQVWNGDHQLVDNGSSLAGSKMSSQPAIIVPFPGDANKYYLFTTSGEAGTNPGLYYHVIDIAANGGVGAITSKNNFLMETREEKLTSAFHVNGNDSWVFTVYQGKIYAYLVSPSGVSGPEISGSGFSEADDYNGVMKVAPDGSLIALARTDVRAAGLPLPFVELYQLNRETGTVSGLKRIDLPSLADRTNYLYGLSFTASSKRFYVSTYDPAQPLDKYNAVYIIDPMHNVYPRMLYVTGSSETNGPGGLGGGLQLGPDKKIYFLARNYPTGSSISRIECPDDSLSAITSYFHRFTGLGFRNFPNFNEMIFSESDPAISFDAGPDATTCSGEPLQFKPTLQNGLTYRWSPAVDIDNFSNTEAVFTKKHVGNSPQTLYYTLTASRPSCPSLPSGRDTIKVTVLPEPFPPVISGPPDVCENDLIEKTYSVDSLSGFQYRWTVTGGQIAEGADRSKVVVNWFAAAATRKVSVTAVNEYGCEGEPSSLAITIRPLPEIPVIRGSRSVCPFVEGVEYWLANEEESLNYVWSVSGGSLANSSTTDTIRVNWFNENPVAGVNVASTDLFGCTSAGGFAVRINVLIKPETPEGITSVCNNKRDAVAYSVYDRPGSVYTWNLSSGTIASVQGNSDIKVTWPGTGVFSLSVSETSTTIDTVCFGTSDALVVSVYRDSSQLALTEVTVNHPDENVVRIDWSSANASFDSIAVESQRGNGIWTVLDSLPINETIYYEPDLMTDSLIYTYRLRAENACGEVLTTPVHNSIRLKASVIGQDSVLLWWNAYINWPGEVDHYEIYRRLNGETDFAFYQTVSADELSVINTQGSDAFEHSFLVIAYQKDSRVISYSNVVSVSFDHQVFIPNIFTPNGDGYNETFFIHKLHLFPSNEINIWNRYGKKVFEARNYRSDWNGENVPAGIYYYQLILNKRQSFKGWIQIQR